MSFTNRDEKPVSLVNDVIFARQLYLFTGYVHVSETDVSQGFDASSPHLPWDHPFYDIARHQIIEVAGQSSLNNWFYRFLL